MQRPVCVSIMSCFLFPFHFRAGRAEIQEYTNFGRGLVVQWNLLWVSAAKKDRKIYEFLNSGAPTRGPPFSNNKNNTVGDRSRWLFVATVKNAISKKHIRYAPKIKQHSFSQLIARYLATIFFFAKLQMIQHSLILYCRSLFLCVTKQINLVVGSGF